MRLPEFEPRATPTRRRRLSPRDAPDLRLPPKPALPRDPLAGPWLRALRRTWRGLSGALAATAALRTAQ